MWPTFELIQFAEADVDRLGPIDARVRKALCVDGVPRDLFNGRYQVDRTLTVMGTADGRTIVRFGSEGRSSAIGVDLKTGEVVAIVTPSSTPGFVNSSLSQFTDTARAVIARFPYYDRGADDLVVELAGRDLAAIIGAIDAAALREDTFWSTFLDDVVLLQDFATEDVADSTVLR